MLTRLFSPVLFATYAVAVWISAYRGLHGDDAAGLICVLLLIAGAGGLLYAALFRRSLHLGVYAPAAAAALAIAGLALGTMSAGEAQVGIAGGLVAGVIVAIVAARAARRRRGRVKAIFISYRRADSGQIVPRIAKKLAAAFGPNNIFRDLVSIELGGNFKNIIVDAVNHSDAVLVVIGDTWLTASDAQGRRRLEIDDDLVRLEVETALSNRNVLVVPLAVGRANLPGDSSLPPTIRELAFRNGGVIRDGNDFDSDMARLIAGLQQGAVTPWSRAASERMNWRRVAAAVTLLALGLGWIGLDLEARDYARPSAVALSPDSALVAAAYGNPGHLRIWKTADGALVHQETLDKVWVESLAWSRDGSELGIGTGSGPVLRLSASTWQSLPALEGHSGRVEQIAWSPDGEWIASGDETGTVHQWNAKTGRHAAPPLHTNKVAQVQWSPDGARLASAAWDRSVALSAVATGVLQHGIERHNSFVSAIAWPPDGSLLASGSLEEPLLGIWNTRRPDEWIALPGHARSIVAIAWSPTAPLLASASDDSVRVWDTRGQPVRALGGLESIHSLAWSPDGRWLAAGGNDSVAVWDTQTWGQVARWIAHANDYEVRVLGWSPDSRRVITTGPSDGAIRVWTVPDARPASTLRLGMLETLRVGFF